MRNLSYKAGLLFGLALLPLLLAGQSNYSNLEFIQNKGQWDSSVTFRGDLPTGAFFLRKAGFTVLQLHPNDLAEMGELMHGHSNIQVEKPSRPVRPTRHPRSPADSPDSNRGRRLEDIVIRSHAYRMNFVDANPGVQLLPAKAEGGYVNYFIGNDSTKWASHCTVYQEVRYKNIYPGIDVNYFTDAGNLKYEFIVHPGADPSRIKMQYEGVNKLSIRKGELIVSTSVGEVKELPPYSYQSGVEGRKKIDSRYKLGKDNTVRFVLGDYDRSAVLVIDPTLIFASLSKSTADNWGYTATPGPDGSFFGGGIVFNKGFPVNMGAFQSHFGGGGFDMGIIKLNSSGTDRVYATYIGGDGKDQPHSMFADPHGNLVIAGRSNSSNYPAYSTYGKGGSEDIVITKLNAAGTALIGSMKIGGSNDDGLNIRDSHTQGASQLVNYYGDDARSEVILDAKGNIFLASCTQSSDFPTTANAVQSVFGKAQDAVLLKLNPDCSAVLYSSYFGGSGYDAGFVLAENPANGDIYMAGGTTSNDLPGSKAGVIQPAFAGGTSDGYIAVFSGDGASLRKSTYLGTNGIDIIYGIQFDKNAYPYVMGTTTGAWPVVNAAYSNPGSRQFIAKLKKDLSEYEYSTIFGTSSGRANISPVAFLVDRCENVYVSGWGTGADHLGGFQTAGTRGLPITPDAIQKTTDNNDFYFLVLKKNAESLLYATFYGQNGGLTEHVDGGTSRYDANGVIYQALCANCEAGSKKTVTWPSTPGAWCCTNQFAPSREASGCNLGMVKIAFNFAGVGSKVQPYINGLLDSTACAPAEIEFRDLSRNARSYEWDFGDGSPVISSASYTQTHSYPQVGTYRVMLIAIDSSSCNIRDTSYTTVFVKDNRANLDWSFFKPDCMSMEYTFINNSTANKPFLNNSFIWDFGDGGRIGPYGTNNITHTFLNPGTYPVRLILTDTNYCNAPDSMLINLRVSPVVKAQIETPPTGCVPYTVTMGNASLGGQEFIWDFGDGSDPSSEVTPTHTYSKPGTYTVSLTAIDPFTCNLRHDTTQQITVYNSPAASFTFTPVTAQENTPNVFTNTSSADAVRFEWDLGDLDTIHTTSRAPFEHQYNRTFTFTACLTAYNEAGCPDTVCQEVPVIVSPRVDVPNAFTPLGPEAASKVYVRGFAIRSIRFTVYSRQGQKVFETTDIKQGWDGRLNGTVLPMDVYAYTLEVEFTDNTRATKKGDITLIR